MAAPDLTKRTTVFIAKIGTDDAGYNVVGAPQPRLTIAQALADLAAMYNAATPAEPKTISLEPGTYTTPAFALPPNIFIEADPDAEGGSNGECIILLTGNITLAAAWSANTAAVGGFRGVTIRQEAGAIDLTMPTPVAGNPARVVYLENVRTDTPSLSWEATSSADALRVTDVIYDGAAGSAIEFSAGAQQINNLQSNCPVLMNDTATIAAAVNVYGLYIVAAPGAVAPGVTFASSGGGLTARIGASDVRALTLNEAGAAQITVYADAVSIPLVANITFAGTAVNADLVRTTDANAISGAGAVSSVTGTAFEATASPTTGAVIIGYSAISRISTSLAIAGATIGTNVLAVTGTSAFGAGSSASEITVIGMTGSVSAGNALVSRITNSNAAGGAEYRAFNSSGNFAGFGVRGASENTYGVIPAGQASLIYSNIQGGMILMADGTGSFIAFGTGTAPATERGRINDTGFVLAVGKYLSFTSGTNQRAGNLTLIGGTLTVNNTTVSANTIVILTRKTSGGTPGVQVTYTLIAATSFTVTSDNVLDTSTFSYLLIEVP